MNVGEWVTVWERELTSLPPFRPITRRTNGLTDGHTRFSAETLNPKPRHTQEDTHYTEWYPDIEGYPDTEWYPLRTHPRGYPLHWVIPWHWGKPITLSDTHYTEWYRYPEFSEPTQEFTHYTEGPCFPHKQTGHWVIPMTPRDISDTEWYPIPWLGKDCCLAGKGSPDGHHWKRG